MGIIGRKVMIKGVLESTMKLDIKRHGNNFVNDSLLLLETYEKQFIERSVRLIEQYEKPVVGVYLLPDETSRTVTEVEGCKYKGIKFITPERAVKALAQMYQYSQWLKE